MEEALRGLLAANAGVAARAGSRIYWRLVPQAQSNQDCIVLHRISGVRDYHTEAPSGLVVSRVQVDCRGVSYSAAKLIARAVVAAVDGYRGTPAGLYFGGIFIDGERDADQTPTGDVKTIFLTQLDLIVWHSETA